MISKERLEELIEQSATIYELYMNKNILEIQLKNNWFVIDDGLYERKLSKHSFRSWWISNLYETKEDAEFVKEFGCIERTERLELPTWEELFKQDRLLDCYTQEFCIVKNRSFIGVVLLGVDFTNEIVEVSIGSDKLFVEELTKENYTIACRKCKELFLGGSDGDIR